MKKKKTIERIFLGKKELAKVEDSIRFHEHLRRYAAVRRFCYGRVLDFACGCGYGSYLLSQNPEVKKVYGVDIDPSAITWAKEEFENGKTSFYKTDINNFKNQVDTLVCLETIEHLENLPAISALIKRCNIGQVIISFPDKKSTHFNPFHMHDFVVQDLVDLFKGFVLYHRFKHGDVQFLLFVKAPHGMPHHMVRNIKDLS